MDVDLDTFLTTVYAYVDAWCQAHPRPPHPGRPPLMSDSEVLTLTLVGQWHGTSERALLRWAEDLLAAYFPVLLSQGAFNRRARALAPRLAALMQDLATQLGAGDDAYEVVDSLPVPLAQRSRGERHRCFAADEAGVGRGGTGKGFYYGVTLLLSVAASGPITGFVVAPAQVEDRWLLGSLLWWRQDPTSVPQLEAALTARNPRKRHYVGPSGTLLGPTTAGIARTGHYLGDLGFTGAVWKAVWREDLHTQVWTHEDLAQPLRHWFHDARQIIETVNGQLTDHLHVKFPWARTQQGLMTRICAKCAALNLGILINRQYDRKPLALGTLFTG